MKIRENKIHFIGICGVAMSALALAFKKEGSDASAGVNWKVTGSDVGFYPPVSTHLKDAGVNFYPGWHPNKMVADGIPDLVVVGNVASSTNPEWLYVKERELNYKSYPEVIAEQFIKKNSIVCAGTFGKSTSTCLLTWILKEAGYNPSYMFGGLAMDNFPSAGLAKSDWSVVEGDEYTASRWDSGPKFFYYRPTHLLLTSVVWDHADVYPTEKSYVEVFQKLVAQVPKNGLKVISEKATPIVIPAQVGIQPLDSRFDGNDKIITYGKQPNNTYMYTNVTQTKNGVAFDVIHKEKIFHLTTSCLGEYMADNATGCFALAHQIGLDPKKIISAIANFAGMKRRLEKRLAGAITVFDDIAHSPSKVKGVLSSLRKIYNQKIYAIFEPNGGNRRPEAAPWYDNAFDSADEVIIPRLTKIKFDPSELEPPFEGDEIARIIGTTHNHVSYIPEDEQLLAYLQQKIQPGDVVVFLGSHGFRGMIETLISKLL